MLFQKLTVPAGIAIAAITFSQSAAFSQPQFQNPTHPRLSEIGTAQTTQARSPQVQMKQAQPSSTAQPEIGPVDLALLAYQGYLRDQGIPSAGALLADYADGRITAQAIVKAAITAHRLSESTLNNQSYLNLLNDTLIELESR